MSKATKSATITARHLWRTYINNGKEVPVEMEFTAKAWAHLGHVRNPEGKLVPKQGYVPIANVQTPPEAKASKGKGKTAINVDEVKASLKAGDKVPVALMIQLVQAESLAIDNPDKMPAHELAEAITKLI